MKRIFVLLLVVVMTLAFVGCQPSATTEELDVESGTVQPEGEVELSADGRYPAETVKIGFVNYSTTAEQVLGIQTYYEYLQEYLNFEIIWSESLRNAEQEFAFIEQCAAAGCQAVIGYYNEGKEESVKLTGDLGMLYWGLAGLPEAYEVVKNEPYYIGGYYPGENGQYESGKAIAEMIIASDCHKVIVVSGGKQYGVQMFIDRYNGIMDTFEEAKQGGYDIEVVYEVPGWPGTEEFAAHQAAALEIEADGLAGTLTALAWVQPMQNVGKFGEIKVACIDTVSETSVNLMSSGMYTGIQFEPSSGFGLAIPMIINALEGFGDNMRDENGAGQLIDVSMVSVASAEDAEYYLNLEQPSGGWIWSIDDIRTVMGAFNPEFTYEDMSRLYTAVSIEEIDARKAN